MRDERTNEQTRYKWWNWEFFLFGETNDVSAPPSIVFLLLLLRRLHANWKSNRFSISIEIESNFHIIWNSLCKRCKREKKKKLMKSWIDRFRDKSIRINGLMFSKKRGLERQQTNLFKWNDEKKVFSRLDAKFRKEFLYFYWLRVYLLINED